MSNRNLNRVARVAAILTLATLVSAGTQPTGAGQPFAWMQFEKGPQEYAGRAYYFLGYGDVRLTIDVPPRAGDTLELLWGAKNDQRAALAMVNGKAVKIVGGGYDGYQWVRVDLPARLTGKGYEIALTGAPPKAAFLAGVRLVSTGAVADGTPDPAKTATHKVTLKAAPKLASGGSDRPTTPTTPSFPEMRAIWDRPAPPPTKPLADAATEAAFRLAAKHGTQAAEMFFRCRSRRPSDDSRASQAFAEGQALYTERRPKGRSCGRRLLRTPVGNSPRVRSPGLRPQLSAKTGVVRIDHPVDNGRTLSAMVVVGGRKPLQHF